jgi:membrane protein implicated in regulation of membrane protease activity
MSRGTMYVIGGVAVAILLYVMLPGWLFTLAVLGLIAIPVVGYFMLDPAQRRRLKNSRKRLG